MKKFKAVAEVLEFIKNAPEQDLVAYVVEHRFNPQHEKVFMSRKGIKKAQYYYITLYGLVLNAAKVVFEENNKRLVEALLVWCEKDPNLMQCFLSHGAYERVMRYVADKEVLECERYWDALKRFKKSELLGLINTKRLSAFAKCYILVYGDEDLQEAVIRKGELQEREQEILWRLGSQKILKIFMDVSVQVKTKAVTRQVMLIRFGSSEELKAAVRSGRFHEPAEKIFLETASLALVAFYVQKYHPKGGDELLFRHLTHARLLNFLWRNWLTPIGEVILVERWHEDELFAYCDKHYLNDENEAAFIRKANHEAIMFYLERHSLCEEAQIALIERQEEVEIVFFEEKYIFSDKANQKLEEYRNAA